MRVVLVARDLLIGSRIAAAAEDVGADLTMVSGPTDLPDPTGIGLVLVDWGDRQPEWGAVLVTWCQRAPGPVRPRVVLFGPHVDLQAHREAREAGLGPMMARSKLVGTVTQMLRA